MQSQKGSFIKLLFKMSLIVGDKLIYETNEQGEKMLVRSVESTQRVFLRFTNKTNRGVDIWWRNFQGWRMLYGRIRARTSFDVNTYITHPWEFTDVTTKESYVIENKRIFRAPKEIANKRMRTNWNITIGVRSLRKTCLLELAQHIHYPHLALQLELPRVLAKELQETIMLYHQPVGRTLNR